MNGDRGFLHSSASGGDLSVEDPRGARQWDIFVATDLYTVGSFDPDHDAVMRIGGEAPGGGPILSVGISAMFEYGVPPPRRVSVTMRQAHCDGPGFLDSGIS